jgi:hypothetical protein
MNLYPTDRAVLHDEMAYFTAKVEHHKSIQILMEQATRTAKTHAALVVCAACFRIVAHLKQVSRASARQLARALPCVNSLPSAVRCLLRLH